MNMTDFSDIKVFIFDYGSTLDTGARHWSYVLWEGFCDAGVPVTESQFREAYVYAERALARSPIVLPGDDFHVLLRKKVDVETEYLKAAGDWKVDEATRREAVARIADYGYGYARRTVAESRRVLEVLGANYPLVLVSNFYGNIQTILRDFHLNLFESVIESALVGVRKPDPAIYRMGVEAAGVQPGEVLVVGDSYGKDIVPAKAIGCRAVWMKGEEWEPVEVDETLPDAVIPGLSGLLELPGLKLA